MQNTRQAYIVTTPQPEAEPSIVIEPMHDSDQYADRFTVEKQLPPHFTNPKTPGRTPDQLTTYFPSTAGDPNYLAKAPSPPQASKHQLFNAAAIGFLVGFSVCLALVCYRRRRTHAA